MDLFQYQADSNDTYQSYLAKTGIESSSVSSVEDIPFLPIELFKRFEIKTDVWTTEHIFKSSGTTSSARSQHHVRSIKNYLENAENIFESIFGPLNNYTVLALLPGYAPESSLVTMISHFINNGKTSLSQFVDRDASLVELTRTLNICKERELPTILFGVTFSLLEIAKQMRFDFPELVIIETGGMKGRKEELTRNQIHEILINSFNVPAIYSEYGMTELLSQSYSKGHGLFSANDMFHVLPGDLYDPLSAGLLNKNARLNVIDLANVDTCAFIATADVGKVYADGSFEVLGRMDSSDIRGCNLLMSI